MMDNTATALKEEGNKAFSEGNYKDAELLYTRAIQRDSRNPLLYTNRAFTRIKLASWDACIDDCLRALEVIRENTPGTVINKSAEMKAYYYLAQAQLALKHPNEALQSALSAYDLCLATRSASTGAVCALALRAKKEKWEVKERERIRQRSELLSELEEHVQIKGKAEYYGIQNKIDKGQLSETEGKEELEEHEARIRRKIEELRSVFAIADPSNFKRREVPDYVIDNITFSVMLDPVVTKRGHSYERATIEQHLLTNPTDPLTREPLTKEDLRPNLALKAACEAFLEENGWAVDW